MTFSRLMAYSASAAAASAAYLTGLRYYDTVEGNDSFSRHTAEQQKKHFLSGMHEPYRTTDEKQLALFTNLFPDKSHLLPTLEELRTQRQKRTPVTFLPLSECPVDISKVEKAKKVVVGGPPALFAAANDPGSTSINDNSQPGIAPDSAFHLEEDAASEAPTSYRPSLFLVRQIVRLFRPHTLKEAERTGLFGWRSLDLIGWLQRPSRWPEGIRIGIAFEKATLAMRDIPTRTQQLQEVASRTKENENAYEQLNRDVGGKLLRPGKGSIIVARNPEEVQELVAMKPDLENEGRKLVFLSKKELLNGYGVEPEGLGFALKPHDRGINSNWRQVLEKRIVEQGGGVINGVVSTVYADNENDPGIVKYQTPDGKENYLAYSTLRLSLGCQRLLNKQGEALFDIVAARGVSVVAFAFLPEGQTLPQIIVCGGTNHVMQLSEPVPYIGGDGKRYSICLLRITCAATITPDLTGPEYDGVAATGLLAAVRKTFKCPIEVLSVRGCNRQVSQFGQMHWISPLRQAPRRSLLAPRGEELDVGTHIPESDKPATLAQVGAGGGGMTMAPSRPPKVEKVADDLAKLVISKK